MQPHDLAATCRLLEPSGWLGAARRFASSLRSAGHEPGRLLVVGTPEQEPWHLTAHLADAARWRAVPSLAPTLVRWNVPAGAPAHLSLGIDAVPAAGRGTTLLVAAPGQVDEQLLQRLEDARRGGANIFALHDGVRELDDLVHESLSTSGAVAPTCGVSFDTAGHVLTQAALAPPPRARRSLWRPAAPSWRRAPHPAGTSEHSRSAEDSPNG